MDIGKQRRVIVVEVVDDLHSTQTNAPITHSVPIPATSSHGIERVRHPTAPPVPRAITSTQPTPPWSAPPKRIDTTRAASTDGATKRSA